MIIFTKFHENRTKIVDFVYLPEMPSNNERSIDGIFEQSTTLLFCATLEGVKKALGWILVTGELSQSILANETFLISSNSVRLNLCLSSSRPNS